MASFSERQGLITAKDQIQLQSIDTRLRNRFWNIIEDKIFSRIDGNYKNNIFCCRLYDDFFGIPINQIPEYRSILMERVESVWSNAKWNIAFDFLEFCSDNCDDTLARIDEELATKFQSLCNKVLEAERSGYRFVDGIISPITNQEEIKDVERAADQSIGSPGAATHIRAALGHYADRDNPDFRNSVKESISAVEATVKWATDDPKANFGTALSMMESRYGLHKALKQGFGSLYGWTSQDGGARHALMDRETITEADARYMLVSCSAFCNYLVSLKAQSNQ